MPETDDRPGQAISRPERVALAAISLAPVVFLPGALNRFVFPKVALVALAVAIAAAAGRRGKLPVQLAIGIAVGSVLLGLAAAFSASPAGALFGRAPRYEGIFVLPVYVGAGAAGAWLLGPARSRRAMPWWLRWLVVGVVLVAIEAILEAFGLRPLATNVARPGSLLGNASDEGAYGVLCLGLLGSVALHIRDRWSIVGCAASAVVVVLSASRGALLGAVVELAIIGLLAASPKARLVVAAALVVVAAATFAVPATRDRVIGSSPLAAETVSGRSLLWQETAKLVAAHPILGVGPSGFIDALPKEHDARWQREIGPANPPDSPHNWILQAASAGGLPLALLACALAVEVLRRGRRARTGQSTPGESAAFTGLLAGVTGYGVALLFHLTSPGTTPLAAFMIGVLVAVPAGVPTVAGRRLAVVTAVVSGALCLVLVLAAIAEIPLRSATKAVAAGEYAAAAHDFSLAHDLRPWDGEIHSTEAFAFATAAALDASAGQLADEHTALGYGLAAARAELSDYPNSVEALENLSRLDELSGQYAAAGRLLTNASSLDPDDPEVALSRGDVDLETEDYKGAVPFLLESASMDVTSPTPWADLFFAYSKLGDVPGAALARERVLSLGGSLSQVPVP